MEVSLLQESVEAMAAAEDGLAFWVVFFFVFMERDGVSCD